MLCGWMERQNNGKMADETFKIFQRKSNNTLMKDNKTKTTAIPNSSSMIPNSTITSRIHVWSTSSKNNTLKKQHFKKQQIKQQLYKKNYLFTKQHTAPCWWITLWINLSLEGATANWRLLVVLRAKTTAVYSITASAQLSKRQRRPAAPRRATPRQAGATIKPPPRADASPVCYCCDHRSKQRACCCGSVRASLQRHWLRSRLSNGTPRGTL